MSLTDIPPACQGIAKAVTGREVLRLSGGSARPQHRFDQRGHGLGRIGGARTGQLTEPDDHRPQLATSTVECVTLQGVGRPGGEHIVEGQDRLDGGIDVPDFIAASKDARCASTSAPREGVAESVGVGARATLAPRAAADVRRSTATLRPLLAGRRPTR